MKYSPETPQDSAKYAVGRAAVDRYAHDGARLGLGSGTTSAWMVRALGEKVAEGLQVVGVPTSNSTRDLALSLDIPLVDINDLDRPLDVTLDGPDEIDHDGDMIKGGGACLLWERMVAEASTKMVCIADDTKLVDHLGRFPLPIEVVQYGWQATRRSVSALLADLGYDVEIVRRVRDGEPVVTDSGNFILDAHMGLIRQGDARHEPELDRRGRRARPVHRHRPRGPHGLAVGRVAPHRTAPPQRRTDPGVAQVNDGQ